MLRRRLHEDAGGEDAVAKSEREVSLFDMATISCRSKNGITRCGYLSWCSLVSILAAFLDSSVLIDRRRTQVRASEDAVAKQADQARAIELGQ